MGYFNPLMPNGISQPNHLDENISVIRVLGLCIFFQIYSKEASIKKQWRTRSDAEIFGVLSSLALFADVPQKGCLAYMG